MPLTVTIDNSPVKILESSLKTHKTIDLTSDPSFTVRDDAGTLVIQPGMPVTIVDSVLGQQFKGYVNDAKYGNKTPNAMNFIQVQTIGNRYLATRSYALKDYENQYSGDIASDLLTYLAPDGVTAAYAIRRDSTASQFGQGTQNNTVGANNVGDGDLELAPVGANVSYHDGTYISGPIAAARISGTSTQGYNANSVYVKIWGGSQLISSGDSLAYEVWIVGTSPEIKASVDFTCSDGTTFRNNINAGTDGQGLLNDPTVDLSGLANDQWYSRGGGVSGSLIGKTIVTVTVALGGSTAGDYIAYFRNIKWINGATLKTQFLATNATSLQTNQILANAGYSNVQCSLVTTYSNIIAGNITTKSISGVKIVKSSQFTWTQNLAGTGSQQGIVFIETSIDNGATWQLATSTAPIPNLQPGMAVTGRSIKYRTTMLLGNDPAFAPSITGVSIAVLTSYAATKSDSVATYDTQADFNTGTVTNAQTIASGGVTLNGYLKPFATDYTNTSLFGISPGISLYIQSLHIQSQTANDAKVRLDSAGNWQNFTAEINFQLLAAALDCGIVYRTTNWGNNNNTFAYSATVSETQVRLDRGTNSTGAGALTNIATATVSLSNNSWHVLRVVVSGNSHMLYLDDVLMVSATDSTYTAAGGIGLRFNNSSGSANGTYFKNFGVCAALSGTWQSAAIDISGAGIYGTSLIESDTTQIPTTTAISVQTSIDGGTTFQAVTNGGAIAGLTVGQSLAGKTLILLVTITSTSAASFATLGGITAWIQGQYASTGYRISPSLSLDPVVTAGSTLASWDGLQPTSTAIGVDTSLDLGNTWTNVGSGPTGSAAIAGIITQPDVIDDTFDSNTSGSYTQTALNSGATWTWDTTNSRVTASGGNNALLEYTGLSFTDGDTMADLDQADNAGIVARVVGTTMYALFLYDASATTFGIHNTYFLYAIVSGAFTQLATGPITFARGTPHRFHLVTQGTTISATMDGVQLCSVTDNRITSPGTVGLLAGSLGRFYQFRVQQSGENVVGIRALTRVRLSTTDPTVTPQLTGLTLSVHDPSIQTGVFIPAAQYSMLAGSKNTLADDFDDLKKQSPNFTWDINDNLKFAFQAKSAVPTPWIATSADFKLRPAPTVENIADLYRNKQLGTGGVDTITFTKKFTGDGETQTWTLDFPVQAMDSIAVNGVTKTFGVKGVDSGRDFYFQQGSNIISQDSSEVPFVETQSFQVTYDAQVTITADIRDDAAIALRASLDNTTGIVQAVEDCTGLTKTAVLTKLQGLLKQYAVSPQDLNFTTTRSGLAPGQILTAFVPEFGVFDGQYLITEITTTWRTEMPNNVETTQPYHAVKATNGPVVGDYTRWLSQIAKGAAA